MEQFIHQIAGYGNALQMVTAPLHFLLQCWSQTLIVPHDEETARLEILEETGENFWFFRMLIRRSGLCCSSCVPRSDEAALWTGKHDKKWLTDNKSCIDVIDGQPRRYGEVIQKRRYWWPGRSLLKAFGFQATVAPQEMIHLTNEQDEVCPSQACWIIRSFLSWPLGFLLVP